MASRQIDVGDENEVKPKLSAYQLEQKEEQEQLSYLLQDYAFRRYMWRIISRCGLYDSAPVEGVGRFEGRRDVGLSVVEDIFTSDAEAYTVIRREADLRKIGKTTSVGK
jgi:hypothetical protein